MFVQSELGAELPGKSGEITEEVKTLGLTRLAD